MSDPGSLSFSDGRLRAWLLAAVGLFGLLLTGGGVGYAWVVSDPAGAMRTLQAWSIDGPLGKPVPVAGPGGDLMTWRAGGGGGPTTVLVHGFGDAGAGWTQVAQALSVEGPVLLLDLPGHGRSALPQGPLELEDLVAGLDTVLAQVEGSIVLAGNSLGGWVSAEWALRRPERIERLVLVNSAGFKQRLDPEVLLPSTREGVRRKNEIVMGEHAPTLPGVLLDGLVSLNASPHLRPLFDHLSTEAPRLEGRLESLTGRIALVWGTPDAYFPVSGYLDRVQAELPAASVRLLEGCGHAPQYSCPEEVAEAIAGSAVGGE